MNNFDRLLYAFSITCGTAIFLALMSPLDGAIFGVILGIVIAFLAICEGCNN